MTGTWHYGLIARWWAEVNRPEAAELAYLRAAIARFGEPALDLGCGTGRLLVPLLADGLDVDGTDISSDMLAYAREAAAAAGIDVEGRLAAQPFDGLDRPRAYATIFSIGSFAIGGSLERDAAALRRIHDHLLPGGRPGPLARWPTAPSHRGAAGARTTSDASSSRRGGHRERDDLRAQHVRSGCDTCWSAQPAAPCLPTHVDRARVVRSGHCVARMRGTPRGPRARGS